MRSDSSENYRKKPREETRYVYYPQGDRDPKSRSGKLILVHQGGKWRYLGSQKDLKWSEYNVMDMIGAIESGRADVYRLNEHGLTVGRAKEEFLRRLRNKLKRVL